MADITDCDTAFEWRNDPQVRSASHDTKPITKSEHENWFSKCLSDQNRVLLVCEDSDVANRKVGLVRFEIKSKKALISIMIAPEMRGKGKARACLEGAIDFMQSRHPGLKLYYAEAKTDNMPSRRSFETANFKKFKESQDIVYYRRLA